MRQRENKEWKGEKIINGIYSQAAVKQIILPGEKSSFITKFNKYKYYYVLLLPGIIYFIVFKYLPMYGITIAFKNFQLSKGVLNSPWVGTKWFSILLSNPDFWVAFKNTIIISFYKIFFCFPAPIILSLLLNEVRNRYFKKSVQTILYLPYFITWVMMSGILFSMFSPESGVLSLFGIKTSPITQPENFRELLVWSEMWKGSGWGTIIYLAAIAGINSELYEAALMDGASRFQRIWYVTLPCIKSTIVVMLILRTGNILFAGFDQIYNLYNPTVYNVSDILDTYVYRNGLAMGRYSLATAAGLFQSAAGIIMLWLTTWLSHRMGEDGLW